MTNRAMTHEQGAAMVMGHVFAAIPWGKVLLSIGLFLATFVVSLLVCGYLVVRLPPTFFLESHPRQWWPDKSPWLRWLGFAAKNVLGIALVVLGVLLSLPGVPGQGVLTILIGVILMDFPGKRRLERKLVSRPSVFRGINRLRARYNRPPLIVEETPST